MPDNLSQPRYTLEDTGVSLKFEIPSRKHWIPLLLHSLWLVGLLVIAVGTAVNVVAPLLAMFSSPALADAPPAFLIVLGVGFGLWYLILTALGIWGVSLLLWQLVGQEAIEVTGEAITIQRRVFGLRRRWCFEAQGIGDMKMLPQRQPRSFGGVAPRPFWVLGHGPLVFQYAKRLIRLAEDVDEAEAKQILNLIWQRFPQYRGT